MTLTWPVFWMVLVGALLHASWNALVKASADKALDTALIHGLGSCCALPLLLYWGWPAAESWPFIWASVALHLVYYIALTGAYQHGDLGLTYPLMRGTAPLLVALSATFTVAEIPSLLAVVGILAICGGVLILGLSAHALHSRRAMRWALLNAVVIALYTVVDALGARACGDALRYVLALFVLDGWPFVGWVLYRRGVHTTLAYAQQRWPVALGAALASLTSYGIALWAMTHAPVAVVAALRETSVLFAAILGYWFLQERLTRRRVMGTLTIVLGVMVLRLS